jgi:hypothetical protein
VALPIAADDGSVVVMPAPSLTSRIGAVERQSATLDKLPPRLAGVETRLTAVETRLTGTEARLTRVETELVEFRVETRVEFGAVRREMREGFEGVRTELRTEIRAS